jgi:SAM-dependent methyltransferase
VALWEQAKLILAAVCLHDKYLDSHTLLAEWTFGAEIRQGKKMTGKKLNLGCGEFKKEGFINVDNNPKVKPDILHDLNAFPYPIKDDEFELIEADHVLEHLDDPFQVVRELHRISVNGGKITVRTPHFSRGNTHPEHKRGFDVSFPYYFNPTFKGGYQGCQLRLEKMRLRWFSQPYLKRTVLSPPLFYVGYAGGLVFDFFASLSPVFCSRIWCFMVGGFEEIEYQFTVVK